MTKTWKAEVVQVLPLAGCGVGPSPAAAAIAGHQLGYGPCWPGPKKKALIHLEPVTQLQYHCLESFQGPLKYPTIRIARLKFRDRLPVMVARKLARNLNSLSSLDHDRAARRA